MAKGTAAISVAEARKRHAGKWLALEVVSRDDNGLPQQVRLLEKAESRAELEERTRALRDVYIAFAGPLVPAGRGFLFGGVGRAY